MYQRYYSKFLQAQGDKLHMAAHSHHLWPDASFDGHQEAWLDACKYVDDKWNIIFENLIPDVQKLIAQFLGTGHPNNIVLGQNTHELIFRLLSSCFKNAPINILTTNSEFYSLARQLKRLDEDNLTNTHFVNVDKNFENNFLEKINPHLDFIILSHVFFNSGYGINDSFIESIIQKASPKTKIVIDGYHAFLAVPFSLAPYEHRIFYVAGGYKYAQAGEGAAFMHLPSDQLASVLRPVYTGWLAQKSHLAPDQHTKTNYADNAMGFMGATFDPTGLYRFRSVWQHFLNEGITPNEMHIYIQSLMREFLEGFHHQDKLLHQDLNKIGHFLCIDCQGEAQAKKLHATLLADKIITDFRGAVLRIGFGAYHTKKDIQRILSVLNYALLAP